MENCGLLQSCLSRILSVSGFGIAPRVLTIVGLCYYVIAFANFLADLVFYFVSYIACGHRFVVVSFRRFQNAVAGNNFKAVCDSVNNKVPVTIGFEVVYTGMLSWLVGLLEVTLTGRKNGFTSIANLEQIICKCHICLILLNFAT